jgi:hypothetical protein
MNYIMKFTTFSPRLTTYTLILKVLNFLTIKSRRMKRVRHVARMGEMKNAYNNLVGKAEGKKPIGSTNHRW